MSDCEEENLSSVEEEQPFNQQVAPPNWFLSQCLGLGRTKVGITPFMTTIHPVANDSSSPSESDDIGSYPSRVTDLSVLKDEQPVATGSASEKVVPARAQYTRSVSTSSSLPDVVMDSLSLPAEGEEGSVFDEVEKEEKPVEDRRSATAIETTERGLGDMNQDTRETGARPKIRTMSAGGEEKGRAYRQSSGYGSKDSTNTDDISQLKDDVFELLNISEERNLSNAPKLSELISGEYSLDSLIVNGEHVDLRRLNMTPRHREEIPPHHSRPSIDQLLNPITETSSSYEYSEPGKGNADEYSQMRDGYMEGRIKEMFESGKDFDEIQSVVDGWDYSSYRSSETQQPGGSTNQQTSSRSQTSGSVSQPEQPLDMIRRIHRAMKCQQWGSQCSSDTCQQTQDLVNHIEKCLLEGRVPGVDIPVLTAIWDHAMYCDEIKCPIPWCHFFYNEEDESATFKQCVLKLLKRYRWDPDEPYLMKPSDQDKYIKLSNAIAENGKQIEGVHWKCLARYGKYGDSVVAQASSLAPRPTLRKTAMYWSLKKTQLLDLEDQHHAVFSCLRGNPCRGIVHHLWYYILHDSWLLTCTELEGQGLRSMIEDGNYHQDILCRQLWDYMKQLIEATEFLHEQNIVFLNWAATSVVMSTTEDRVKLMDFTGSINKNVQNYKNCLFSISRLLPPAILPPELLVNESRLSVSFSSDIWGLAALAYECHVRHMIRHHLRHEPTETAFEDMESSPVVSLDEVEDQQLKEFLQMCFKVKPERRPTLEQLSDKVTNILESRAK